MTDSRSEASAVREAAALAPLEAQSDEELRATIDRAKALLAARRKERQAQALAAIRRLAKEHGLDVQAARRRGKPGRPRKSEAS